MNFFRKILFTIGFFSICLMLIGKLFFVNYFSDKDISSLSYKSISLSHNNVKTDVSLLLIDENNTEEEEQDAEFYFHFLGSIFEQNYTYLYQYFNCYLSSNSLFKLWSAPPLFILFNQLKTFLSFN